MRTTGWLDKIKDIFTFPSVNIDLLGVFIIEEAATLPGTAGALRTLQPRRGRVLRVTLSRANYTQGTGPMLYTDQSHIRESYE